MFLAVFDEYGKKDSIFGTHRGNRETRLVSNNFLPG